MLKKIFLLFFISSISSLAISLEDAIQLGLQNNKRILIQEAEFDSSASFIKETRGIYDTYFNTEIRFEDSVVPSTSAFAKNNTLNNKSTIYSTSLDGYLPTGTSYSFFNFDLEKRETDFGTDAMSPSWISNLSFKVKQNLFKDYGLSPNNAKILIAKGNAEISKIELEKVMSSVILEVETKYWNSVYAKSNLDLAYSSLELAEEIVDQNTIEVELGTLPRISLLQAQAEAAYRKVEIVLAENLYNDSIDSLKVVLGLSLNDNISVDSSIKIKELDIVESEDIEFIAINNRPEVKQESIQLDNSEELLNYYSNQILPDLDIEAMINYSGLGGSKNSDYSSTILGSPRIASQYNDGFSDSIDSLSSLDNLSWAIGAKLKIPLSNNIAESRFEVANAKKRKHLIMLEQVLDQIHLQARSSYRDVLSNLENIEARRRNLELHQEILYNEEERFEVGVSRTKDLLEAQRDLIKAQIHYNKSLADYNVSITSFDHSLGVLINKNKIVIDN
jgi:outer membrane protein TolC